MPNSTQPPDLPTVTGLTWRVLTPDDRPALVDWSQAILRADGGLPFLFASDAVRERFFPDRPGARLGAFEGDGRLGAVGAIHSDGSEAAPRATLVGGVRPELRGRGLGDYLLRWAEARAAVLLPPAGPRTLRVATEAWTEAAHRLYTAHGLTSVFDEYVMRRDLRTPLPERPLPEGVTLATWAPATAEAFFQAYHAAFRERPGFPGYSAAEWIDGVNGNDLVTDWTLLARAGDEPLGFVIGTLDLTASPHAGYVAQIGVVPAARRRGLASALMVEALRRMQAAGAPYADLTVHLNNPGASAAYARVGYAVVGRRARYERAL